MPLYGGFSVSCETFRTLLQAIMKAYIFIKLIYILHYAIFSCCGDNYYSTYNWKFHFPQGSSMGLFFAIAVPLDIPSKNIFLSYYFEGVYSLPGNETKDDYPPLVERSETSRDFNESKAHDQTITDIDRKLIYNVMETKLTALGYPGHPCLLRMICEMGLTPVKETNGVLGDLFHIIFTPSTSLNTELNADYMQAENYSKIKGNCKSYYGGCDISILDLITRMEHAVEP